MARGSRTTTLDTMLSPDADGLTPSLSPTLVRPSMTLLDRSSVLAAPTYPSMLAEIEDNRRWQPAPIKSPNLIDGTRAPVKAAPVRSVRTSQPTTRIAFAQPSATIVCIRRSKRREVLFAKRKTGRGHKRGKHNIWSHISCKR